MPQTTCRCYNPQSLPRPAPAVIFKLVPRLVVGWLMLLLSFPASAIDVDSLIRHIDRLWRGNTSHATMTMSVKTQRYQRSMTMEAWSRGSDYSLVVIKEPVKDRGIATLKVKENIWNYLPKINRVTRVPSSMMSGSWMGSHFTNDDLMRETDFLQDYDASLAWHEEGGKRLLQTTLTPKPKAPVVWSRVVFLLDPSDYMPLRADYIADGKTVRTLSYSDPHPLAGRRVPFTMVMVPNDKPGESTRVEYQDLKFGVKVDPGLFTQRGLRRVAKQ